MGEKVLFAGQPFELEGTPRRVGDAAPDFVLTGQDLAPVSSERLHGKVRVYSVFPSIDTPSARCRTSASTARRRRWVTR